MKKKVALLLALVMVLSLVPVSVFGDVQHGTVQFYNAPQSAPREHQVNLDLRSLHGFHLREAGRVNVDGTNLIAMEIDFLLALGGNDAGNVRFPGTIGGRSDAVAFQRTHPTMTGAAHRVFDVTDNTVRWLVPVNPVWASADVAEVVSWNTARIPTNATPRGWQVIAPPIASASPSAINAATPALDDLTINVMGRLTNHTVLNHGVGVNVPVRVNWADDRGAMVTATFFTENGQITMNQLALTGAGHVLSFYVPVIANHNAANLSVSVGNHLQGNWAPAITNAPLVVVAPTPHVEIRYNTERNFTDAEGQRVPFYGALALRDITIHESARGGIRNFNTITEYVTGMELRLINTDPNEAGWPGTTATRIGSWADLNTPLTDANRYQVVGRLAWYHVLPGRTPVRLSEGPNLVRQDFLGFGTGPTGNLTFRDGIPQWALWRDSVMPRTAEGFGNNTFSQSVIPPRGSAVLEDNWFTVRLEAPLFYHWGTIGPDSDAELGHPNWNWHQATPDPRRFSVVSDRNTFGANNPDDIGNPRFNSTLRWENVARPGVATTVAGTPVDQLRHVLYVHIDAGPDSRRFVGLADFLRIRGLWLIPEDRAPLDGNVDVVAEIVRATDVIDGQTRWLPADRYHQRPLAPNPNYYFRVLPVGVRTGPGLQFHIRPDVPMAEVQTGHLGERVIGSNPNNNNLNHYRGVVTSSILLHEATPGSWGTGLVSPTRFEFLDENGNPHPGIRLLGARVRHGNNHADWVPGEFFATPSNNRNNNRLDFVGWASAIGETFPVVQGVVNMNQHALTVWIPSQHIFDVHLRRTLEMRLYLSITPGYEEIFGEEIRLTASGTGVSNLPEADRTITVAYARDPITVELLDGATPISVGHMYQVRQAPVSDIEVTLTEMGARNVRAGHEIWFYVVGDHFGPGTELLLNADVNIQVVNADATGMRIDSNVRRINHPGAINHGALAVTVTAPPRAGITEMPIIRLTNVRVGGEVHPNVNYELVVSGTFVAQNEQNVRIAMPSEPGDATELGRMNVGIFTARPYARTIAEYDRGGVTGIVGPGNRPDVLVLREDMAPIDTEDESGPVQMPFFLWTNSVDSNYVVSMLNPRVFAWFIGGEITYNAGTVTFNGPDSNGNERTVVLTIGSTNATVDGQQVDIATVAGRLSGPPNSIETIRVNDRTYVPLRFLANIFLLEIEWQDGTTILRHP